jgi:zinc transport system permease protein
MLDDFIVRAVLAGLGIVIAAAPLGCMVVWRKMAYFSDATAHASILGVALALSFSVSIFAGVLIVSLVMAILISTLSGRGFGMDTLLGVLAHSGLAFGLVAVSLLDGVRVDLMAYLFGDILAVSRLDLVVIWGGALAVLVLLWWRWSALLTATLNNDLAYASGIDPKREQLLLTLALALVVAVAIKVVGVLLIGAMLIIPAATARVFARTPEIMAVMSAGIGGVGVVFGVQASVVLDVPTGPMIVCLCAVLFAISNLVRLVLPKS